MLACGMRAFIFWFAAFSLLITNFTRADVVNLANGDRFIGSVELVNTAEIHLKSETLGLVKIPRAKVSSIYFGTNQPPALKSVVKQNAADAFDPKAIDKVQEDLLATAGPEANAMFKE